jgi:hypothetical protein
MKIELETTYDDCVALMLFATKRHRNFTRWAWFWRWVVAGSAAALVGWELRDSLGAGGLLVGLGIGTMVAQLMPWLLERRLVTKIHTRLADPNIRLRVLGRRSLEILPEGLKVSGADVESLYRWSMVESIERVPPRLFVLVRGTAGVAIPLGAVDADAFIVEAHRLGMAEAPNGSRGSRGSGGLRRFGRGGKVRSTTGW